MVGVGGWYTCRGNHLAKVETNMEEIASVAQKRIKLDVGPYLQHVKEQHPQA